MTPTRFAVIALSCAPGSDLHRRPVPRPAGPETPVTSAFAESPPAFPARRVIASPNDLAHARGRVTFYRFTVVFLPANFARPSAPRVRTFV